jgi:hypothetical protein
MFNNKRNPKFIYNNLISRGVSPNSIGYIYIIKYKDSCKLGFTTNLNKRIKSLGNPEVILTKEYKDLYKAIEIEIGIHVKYMDRSLSDGSINSTEIYPLDILPLLKEELFEKELSLKNEIIRTSIGFMENKKLIKDLDKQVTFFANNLK